MIYIVSDDSFFIYGLARYQTKNWSDSCYLKGETVFVNLNRPLFNFEPKKNDVIVISIENDISRFVFLNKMKAKGCKILILTDLMISKSISKTFLPVVSKKIDFGKFIQILQNVKTRQIHIVKNIPSKAFNIFDRQARGLSIQDGPGLETLTTKQIYSITDRFCRLYGLKKMNGKK
ncbi:hypothetical protein [Klebsiella oxytoca]|uniref:hypothetical protein n=1 Tax=Klebsiella oxytoca TaxID=571 RepID=UPI002245C245|nr:hypothetical protein [Klebsiella oxytoca]MCW9445979.1 hypothetical protein [Klebsiella oxytoca]